MAIVEKFEDLEGWKHARELTNVIYGLTRDGRLGRDFGLRN